MLVSDSDTLCSRKYILFIGLLAVCIFRLYASFFPPNRMVNSYQPRVHILSAHCPKEKRQEKVESGNVRERNITEGEKQLIRDKRILLDLATGNNWKSEDLIKVDKNVER